MAAFRHAPNSARDGARAQPLFWLGQAVSVSHARGADKALPIPNAFPLPGTGQGDGLESGISGQGVEP